MRRVINTLRIFSFWGTLFFLLLWLGFGVPLADFFSVIKSGPWEIILISAYCLVSVIVFTAFNVYGIVDALKGKGYGFEKFLVYMGMVLWPPYKVLDIKGQKMDKKRSHAKSPSVEANIRFLWLLFCFVLWWGIVVLSTLYFRNGTDIISIRIRSFSTIQVVIRCAFVLIIFLTLLLLKKPLSIIKQKLSRKRFLKEYNSRRSETKRNNYYDRHPSRIPAGCRACGGPYPDCKSSCNLYDD